MRWCILGGGGSFGLAVTDYLLAMDEEVLGIGRSPPKPECFSLGIGRHNPHYQYRQFHITYEHDELMAELDRYKPQIIVNFAAQGESAASFHNCWRYYETNCVGLSCLVEALAQRDYLERLVHIGTSELYGDTLGLGAADEDATLNPTSPYAVSKAALDIHLMILAKRGFPAIILRPSNAYGEGQQLYRLIPKAILAGLTGRKLPLHGGGRAEKSWIHNHDLARAVHIVATKGTRGHIYNAGPDGPTAVRSVVGMIAKHLLMVFEDLVEETIDREHQDSKYWLNSAKIRALGWKPCVGWDEGIDRMIHWVRKYQGELSRLPTEFVMRA